MQVETRRPGRARAGPDEADKLTYQNALHSRRKRDIAVELSLTWPSSASSLH